MKKSIVLIVLCMFAVCMIHAQEVGRVNLKMTTEKLHQVYPETVPVDASPNGQYSRAEVFFDLNGDWVYNFKNGQLEWCIWDVYLDDITEKNFNLCLDATNNLISKYSKSYGPAIKTEEGNNQFRDPYIDHHWGYKVIDAYWESPRMKIHISFEFLGGKGEYKYLVKMAFFKADYPYWD